MIGTVYKSTGSWYSVKTDEGKFYQCKIKGKLRLENFRSTNPVAVGDRVNFSLECNDEENLGLLNIKHAGTLPLVESIRLYSIKYKITKTSTFDRLEELNKLKVLTNDETDFFKNAYRFMSSILLQNQVERTRKGLPIKNFIDPKSLLEREKKVLKIYLKKIRELKQRVRVDIGEEYF